jgi:DNA sulfur modification protein DndC
MSLDVRHLENEIIDQYLYDENDRPWIIGFSGGKDSTMLLQVVWRALKKIEPILLKRRIYVVCNDTMVENPRMVKFIKGTLKKIQIAANEQQIPLTVHETMPKMDDSFWVRLIGLGYPAPNRFVRWCTERLKINPTTQFIKDKISEEGEAIILLGTRSAESGNRAKSIKKHEIKGQRLRKHQLPNAFVYAPIKDVTTNEVWQYLNQVPPPWGGTHKELVTLYRNANAGDCPLVIDETTPSCGNSRFGCWTCTVVNKDKSMEGLIDNGEE